MTAARFCDMDWSAWTPRERATLMIIRCGDQILLIHKKRGLGAGKFNGPGGRVETGETPLQAAIREVDEELRVWPLDVRPAGELWFQFVDGYSLHGYVFTATGISGEPQETDEAQPAWFPALALPYHNMWADDRVWMPLLLAGKLFVGRFLFEGDQMLGCEIDLREGLST